MRALPERRWPHASQRCHGPPHRSQMR